MTGRARTSWREVMTSALASLAVIASGCAGGTAKVRVISQPEGLNAYAIPGSVFRVAGEDTILELEREGRLREYRFSNPTPTEARTVVTGLYYFLVTDGMDANFQYQTIRPAAEVHEIEIVLR